jgi:hypothetical protein
MVWSTVDNNYTLWRQVGKQLFCKIHFTIVAIHFITCISSNFCTKFCVQHKSIFCAGMNCCKTWIMTCRVFNLAESHARKASLGVFSYIFIPFELWPLHSPRIHQWTQYFNFHLYFF